VEGFAAAWLQYAWMSNETKELLRICEQLPQAKREQLRNYARTLLPHPSPERTGASAVTVVLPADERPVWERIASLAETLPEEAIAGLPADGASQVDHYLYGAPKRAE
jgi:hypothetical protein